MLRNGTSYIATTGSTAGGNVIRWCTCKKIFINNIAKLCLKKKKKRKLVLSLTFLSCPAFAAVKAGLLMGNKQEYHRITSVEGEVILRYLQFCHLFIFCASSK